MVSLAVLALGALVLFSGGFFSKRRFGLMGLALAAGSVLAGLWSDTVAMMVELVGIVPNGAASHFIAVLILTLLPSVLFFFHAGYVYKSLTGRIIGATLFTVVAFGFLADSVHEAIALDGIGAQVVAWVRSYDEIIVGAGVMAAVLDILISKAAKSIGKKSRH